MAATVLDNTLSRNSNASKLERLNCRVVKLLTAAVQEVLEAVRETVSEYQEKTSRTQRENERLRLKLQDALNKLEKEREVSRLACISLSINNPSPEPQQMPEPQYVPCLQQDSLVKADTEPEAVCDLQVALTLPDTSTPTTEQVNTSDLDCTIKGMERGTCVSDTSQCVDIKTEPVAAECSSQQQIPEALGTKREDPSEQTAIQDSIRSSGYVHSTLGTLGRCVGSSWSMVSSLQGLASQRHSARDEEHHMCHACGKTFSRVGNLRIHQRCHTGEKPYRCLVCGRCFTQAGDLKKHKRVHTGEKPYCCVQCGKSFSRGENLKRHQKIHIGDRFRLQSLWRDSDGLTI